MYKCPRVEKALSETGIRELSTGLVIAGAYADKLRRTLFAQLRDMVKQNKEFAREVARASGEINRLLYIILVEKLGVDKGDVVRIRVQYSVEDDRIKWYYDTLRVEYFRRVPDEEVMKVVREAIEKELPEIQRQYAVAPPRVEEEKPSEEKPSVKLEEETKEMMGETRPLEKTETPGIVEVIGEAVAVGETMEGGVVFQLVSREGGNVGIVSIEPRGGVYVAEAIVIPKPGEAYKVYVKLSRSIEDYKNDPKLLLEELEKTSPVKVSISEAREFIESKMESIV